LVDLEELEQIRLRMVQFDERREYVIKVCCCGGQMVCQRAW
jgi:hypothetical protein